MSSTRWQIEPPPLAPGAGAQWLIAALVALGPFSLTMYQPALPAIARSLNISTAQVQLTLTVYLASFAIGQLIYGPMSDHFGRRRTLLVGLAIFVVGAVACALASSAAVLIAARVLQGLGACAGPALGRAMIRDLYGAKGSAKAMAFVKRVIDCACDRTGVWRLYRRSSRVAVDLRCAHARWHGDVPLRAPSGT